MSIAAAINLFFAGELHRMTVNPHLTVLGLLCLLSPQTQFLEPTSWTNCDAAGTSSDKSRCFNTAQSKMWGVFLALEVVAFTLIFLFVPEIAKCTPCHKDDLNYLSLEEINSIFEVPTLHHTWYRVRYVVPQAWRRLLWKLFGVKVDGREPSKIIVVWRWPPNEIDQRKRDESSESKAGVEEVEEVSHEGSGHTSSIERIFPDTTKRLAHQGDAGDVITPVAEPTNSPPSFTLPDLERGPSFRASHFDRVFGETSRTRSF